MPTCMRCGEWSPPSSRQSTCSICRGELASGERAEPAIRKRERFRELFLRRAALTPQEQSEYEDLLDQRAALRGQSRHDYAAALEEKWEADQRRIDEGREAFADFERALTLVAIVTIIALGLLVVWWLIGGSMLVGIVGFVVTIALVILVVWVADRRKWAGRRNAWRGPEARPPRGPG